MRRRPREISLRSTAVVAALFLVSSPAWAQRGFANFKPTPNTIWMGPMPNAPPDIWGIVVDGHMEYSVGLGRFVNPWLTRHGAVFDVMQVLVYVAPHSPASARFWIEDQLGQHPGAAKDVYLWPNAAPVFDYSWPLQFHPHPSFPSPDHYTEWSLMSNPAVQVQRVLLIGRIRIEDGG